MYEQLSNDWAKFYANYSVEELKEKLSELPDDGLIEHWLGYWLMEEIERRVN
jgi:hypothetical protein